ncbi:hypothetical protein BegalDRAFT_2351 [Beggiatoa alba B18LD]|uniref:Uncharacterized protein n=1 Tax=Beggiatoa alba B18LD TaxID=395493 RepID=I3CHW2_9GAMM|nr:hypothetical protein [Beggiatoa alba]EIJ43205.1 hypothetical protein BegalDRAFT_2351 [Beggiatoa alba B18LD]
MKSQDIFLLLKLVSLQQQEQKNHVLYIADKEKELEQIHRIRKDNSIISPCQDWNDSAEIEPFIPETSFAARYTVRTLSTETGMSKSQISLSLQRCYAVTLAKIDRITNVPRVNIKALTEFLVYGIRYVFPAELKELTRGVATGLAAPVLKGEIMTAGELSIPVWEDAHGKTKGQCIEPLYKTVSQAIRRDERLYAFLALTDAIRIGQPRERAFATDKLSKMLRELL